MTAIILDMLAYRAARKPICRGPLFCISEASARAVLVEHNRAAVGKIQVRADERVVVLKVRQPDGGMK